MNDYNHKWPATLHWAKGRRMRPAAWRAPGAGLDFAFQTLTSPGDLAPAVEPFPWSLHSGLDSASCRPDAVRVFGNGMIYQPDPGPPVFFYFITAPGILIGQSQHPVPPSLFSAEYDVRVSDHLQWIEGQEESIVLLRSPDDGSFALARTTGHHADAVHLAQSALATPPAERLPAEWLARRPFWIEMENSHCPEAVLSYGYEWLTSHLRGPEGVFSARWSEASNSPPGIFSLNQLFSLTTAWSMVDQAVAEDLVRCALDAAQHAGRLPAWMRPDGHASDHNAWPLLAQCARKVIENGAQPDFLATAMPRLQAYVDAALTWFNADDFPVWRHPEEAFLPDTFDENLATVDLAVFLIMELDALLHLSARYSDASVDTERYREIKDHLAKQLIELHWDPVTRCFHDRYVGKEQIKRTTIGSYWPLMLPDLPAEIRTGLLSNLTQRKEWKKGHGLPAWEYWESDPVHPPILTVHQHFLIHALRVNKEDGLAETFSKTLRTYVARLTRERDSLPDHLDEGEPASPERPSLSGAALILVLEADVTALERAVTKASPLLQWMDRHRLPLIIGISTTLSTLMLVVVLAFLFKRAPTVSGIGTMTSLAQRHYEDGRYEEAARLYRELIASPHVTFFAYHRLGNTLFRQGDYAGAEEQYRKAIELNEDSPASLRNLAVSLHRQGRDMEAIAVFNEVVSTYEGRYPVLVDQARVAINLLSEKKPQREVMHDRLP